MNMKRIAFLALVFMVCGFSVFAQAATGIKVRRCQSPNFCMDTKLEKSSFSIHIC